MENEKILNDDVIVKKQRMKGKFSNLWKNFNNDRDFKLFLIVGLFTGIASGINSTVF